jgi:hypothetical protein
VVLAKENTAFAAHLGELRGNFIRSPRKAA